MYTNLTAAAVSVPECLQTRGGAAVPAHAAGDQAADRQLQQPREELPGHEAGEQACPPVPPGLSTPFSRLAPLHSLWILGLPAWRPLPSGLWRPRGLWKAARAPYFRETGWALE